MPKKEAAIGVFSKTPGLSPLKTRLSKDIGKKQAEAFFTFSIDCIRATLMEFANDFDCDVYFFTAEKGSSTHHFWKDDKCVEQEFGSLGERLNRAYDNLHARYEKVIIIGGDSPTISINHFEKAFLSLMTSNFVMGPAFDGGFYLIGGKLPIPCHVWTTSIYSAKDTFESLSRNLEEIGEVVLISKLLDVDHSKDLTTLHQEMGQIKLNQSQEKLLAFLNRLIS